MMYPPQLDLPMPLHAGHTPKLVAGTTLRESIIDAIGRTPLVRLVASEHSAAVYGKLELLNPFGMKDRVAKRAILEARHTGAFWPRQYENPDNPLAYAELASELLTELGHIDVLVGSVGSGGSLCGTARELRKDLPELRVVAVAAVGSILFDQPDRPTRLQSGLGNRLVPRNVDPSVIDEIHWLSDEEAFAATFRLARDEKIFAGNSSGSAYAVARWVARSMPSSSTVAALLPDRDDRYIVVVCQAAW